MVHKQTTLTDSMHRARAPTYPPISNLIHESPPLVLASQHQTKVEQNPEEEAPSHSYPQAVPLAQISDPLLLQYVRACGQARGARNLHPKSAAYVIQQLQFQGRGDCSERRVVEDLNALYKALAGVAELVLQNRLERVLHQRDVMEPKPVARDSVAVYEEAAEEKEIGQDGHDDGIPEHDVRNDAG